MKHIAALLIVGLLAACSSFGDKAGSLPIGTSWADTMQGLGQPDRTAAADGQTGMAFFQRPTGNARGQTADYFLFFQDQRLIGRQVMNVNTPVQQDNSAALMALSGMMIQNQANAAAVYQQRVAPTTCYGGYRMNTVTCY